MSPVCTDHEESKKASQFWSPRLQIPSHEDVSSHLSLTSPKSGHLKVESSTFGAFNGAENVRAPSPIRAYMLSQPTHSVDAFECHESPRKQIECTTYNHCGSFDTVL